MLLKIKVIFFFTAAPLTIVILQLGTQVLMPLILQLNQFNKFI